MKRLILVVGFLFGVIADSSAQSELVKEKLNNKNTKRN